MNKIFPYRKSIWKSLKTRYAYSTFKKENQSSEFKFDMRFLDNFSRPLDSEIFSILVHWPFDYKIFSKIQDLSTFSLVADGAANKLSTLMSRLPDKFHRYPDAVVGDFDSANKEALDYFHQHKVNIINNPCQNDTDSEKCLQVYEEWFKHKHTLKKDQTHCIIVCGGLGGRIDHVLNNFHVAFKYTKKFWESGLKVNIMLLDNNSLATCLLPGKTSYRRSVNFERKDGCGVFPLLSDSHVKTTGLKWNLQKDKPLRFGEFTSSSNEIVEEVVVIENDEPVIWTTTNILHDKYRKLKQNLMRDYSLE